MTATPAELSVIAAARECRPLLWAVWAEDDANAAEAAALLYALDALAAAGEAVKARARGEGPGPLPRVYAGAVREGRPVPFVTFDMALAHPGEWIIDSVSDDEPSAHNRASFLRRRARRAGGPTATLEICYRRDVLTPHGWNVLVALRPPAGLPAKARP